MDTGGYSLGIKQLEQKADHSPSWRSNLLLRTSSLSFHTAILYAFLVATILTRCPAHHNPLNFTILLIFSDLNKSWGHLLLILIMRVWIHKRCRGRNVDYESL
jgi:hypothetical protein